MSNPFDPNDANCKALAENAIMIHKAGGPLCPYEHPAERLAFWQGYWNEPSHRQEPWHRGRMVAHLLQQGASNAGIQSR